MAVPSSPFFLWNDRKLFLCSGLRFFLFFWLPGEADWSSVTCYALG